MEGHIFLGVDLGKSAHYAMGVDQVGKTVHQQAVANDEAGLRELVQWAVEHTAAVIVDQPGSASYVARLCWLAAATSERLALRRRGTALVAEPHV
jgi:hypothetical protein